MCCAVVPPLISARGGWGGKKEATSKPVKKKAAPKVSQAKQAEQARLRKEMEEEIAQERRPKLMQDAAKPPRLPAVTRAQSKAAGVLKRPGIEQTKKAGKSP